MSSTFRERAEVDVTGALVRLGYSFTTASSATGPSRIWTLNFTNATGAIPAAIPVILFVNKGLFGAVVVLDCGATANVAQANQSLFQLMPAVRVVADPNDAGRCWLRCDFALADEGPAVALSVVAFACTISQIAASHLCSLPEAQFTVSRSPNESVHALEFDLDEMLRVARNTSNIRED